MHLTVLTVLLKQEKAHNDVQNLIGYGNIEKHGNAFCEKFVNTWAVCVRARWPPPVGKQHMLYDYCNRGMFCLVLKASVRCLPHVNDKSAHTIEVSQQ